MSTPHAQLSPPPEASRQTYPFALADLPYSYDALEPHIDQKTLQVHHRGHHATYVKKLNETVAKRPELHRLTLAELLRDLDKVPADIRAAVKNNGGGHLNHDLFWSVLTPETSAPQGEFAAALTKQFRSVDEFRRKFGDVAAKHFASGWVALAYDETSRQLEIVGLKDHEVLVPGAKTGLLILDVWEHAYYVKYQNRRPEFIEAFWNVVNWAHVAELYERRGTR